MDWLINKPIEIIDISDDLDIQVWQYITYIDEDKKMVGTYIWYYLPTNKQWKFDSILVDETKDKFDKYQKKANEYFVIFKKEFKSFFPNTKPVTARVNLSWDMIYFYFYCEDRLNFVEFLKSFRGKIPINFFLYQVWARDMVRLHPQSKEWLSECWCWPMWCCGTWVLPTVEMDNLVLQWLEWRDIEKLKWRCGKLKCSIVYERYIYTEEAKKFPNKWDTITIWDQTWRCIGYNIFSGEVVGRSDNGNGIFRGNYMNISKVVKNNKYNMAEQLWIDESELRKLKE